MKGSVIPSGDVRRSSSVYAQVDTAVRYSSYYSQAGDNVGIDTGGNYNPYRIGSYYSAFNKKKTTSDPENSQLVEETSEESSMLQSEQFWKQIIGHAVYFHGHDTLFGDVIAVIFACDSIKGLNSLIISKHGQTLLTEVNYSHESIYYPAVKNLRTREMRHSKLRKCLAVSLLKTYSMLEHSVVSAMQKQANLPLKFDWDETMAGELASRMHLIETQDPTVIGNYLLSLGYFRNCERSESHVVDVAYENRTHDDGLTDRNNILAYLLGEQLENLYDPLMEYSPEKTGNCYFCPKTKPDQTEHVGGFDDVQVKAICKELIHCQTNITISFVQILQKLIVPLRAKVMNGDIPGYTTDTLNHIFPPTIDEVTRINCIFLDTLKSAEPYGSFEILRACGTTIPYFYRACMRHNAATKDFPEVYEEISKDLQTMDNFELSDAQKKNCVNIIMSTSSNLVKIESIIQRLLKAKDWSACSETECKQVGQLYQSINDTISSFGSDQLTSESYRVYSDDGTLVTPVAVNWPKELREGWQNRRIIGVFDVEDLLVDGIKNKGIIAVLSDYIATFSIDDGEYYCRQWDADNLLNLHRPAASDILMHLLLNEVPVSTLPRLRLKSWTKIENVIVSHYSSGDSSYLKLFCHDFVCQYRVEDYSGRYISDAISKAKILNKSQAFHLFKHTVESTTIYYTAHEAESYDTEESIFPILVAFNMDLDFETLARNNLFALIALNFVDGEHIEIEGATVVSPRFRIVVPAEELTQKLAEKIASLIPEYYSTKNSLVRDKLLVNNGRIVSSAIQKLLLSEEERTREMNAVVKVATDERNRKIRYHTMEAKQQSSRRRPKSCSAIDLQKLKGPGNDEKKKKRASWGFFGRMFKNREDKGAVTAPQTPRTVQAGTVARFEDGHFYLTVPNMKDNMEQRSNGQMMPPLQPGMKKDVTKKDISNMSNPQEMVSSAVPESQHNTSESIPSHALPPILLNQEKNIAPVDKQNGLTNAVHDIQQKSFTPERPASTYIEGEGDTTVDTTGTDVRTQKAEPVRIDKVVAKGEVTPTFNENSPKFQGNSKLHRVGSSIHIGEGLKKFTNVKNEPSKNVPLTAHPHSSIKPNKVKNITPWAEIRLANAKGVFSNSKLEKANIPNPPVMEPIKNEKPAEVKPKVQSVTTISKSPSYYNQFRETLKMQERTVKDKGIVEVKEENANLLSKNSMIYSPSVRVKLSMLGKAHYRHGGRNWIKVSGSSSSSIPGRLNSIVSSNYSGSTSSSSISRNGNVMKHFPPEDDEIFYDSSDNLKRLATNGTQGSSSYTSSGYSSFRPIEWSDLGADTILAAGGGTTNSEHTGDSATITMSSLSTDNTTIRKLSSDKLTPKSLPRGSLSQVKEGNGLHSKTIEKGLTSDSSESIASINRKVKAKLYKQPEQSMRSLADLVGDKSYEYIGEILAGNLKIGDSTLSASNSTASLKKSPSIDYDRVYSDQLRNSSYRYLANIISTGSDDDDQTTPQKA